MKNLKRALSVVLALTMVLGTVVFAGTFTDVDDSNSYAEAIELGAALKLFTGYEEGDFRPEGDLTRAEFAAIVVRFLGQAQSTGIAGATAFTDVASTHWAAGAINIATGLKIINGYGDGNFGPEDKVTYEQAVKMLVVSLGYTEEVVGPAGYPVAYLTIAQQTGMVNGVKGVALGQPINRGQIAQLVYNALDIPLIVQSGYSQWKEFIPYDGSGDTYRQTTLTEKLGVVKLRAIVNSSYETTNARKADQVNISITNAYRNKYSDEDYDSDQLLAAKKNLDVIVGETGLKNLIGAQVNVYIQYDENSDETSVAVYARRYIASADELAINSTDIEDVIPEAVLAGETSKYVTVEYEPSGSTKTEKFRVGVDASVYVNGQKSNSSTAAHLVTLLDGGFYGTATFSLENTGSEITSYDYDTIFISDYKNFVVEEVDTRTGRVTSKVGNISVIIFNENNTDNISTLVDKDGKKLEWSSLEENDVLAVQRTSGTKTVTTATLVQDVVTGRVDGKSDVDEKITINGADYKASGQGVDYDEFNLGYEGSFYLDILGNIAYFDAEATSTGKYAYVLKAGASAGWGKGFDVALFTSEGKIATYTTADKIRVTYWDVATSKTVTQTVDADVFATGAGVSFIESGTVATASVYELKSTGFNDRVIKYGLNGSGFLNAVTFANTASAYKTFTKKDEAANATFDGERERFNINGIVYVNDATAILRVNPTIGASYNYLASDYELLSLAALSNADVTGLTAAAYDVDTRTGVAKLVVVEGNKLRGSAAGVALVAGVGRQNNSAGTEVDRFTIFTKANVNDFKSSTLLAAEDSTIPAIVKGNVITTILNGAGEIAEAELITAFNATTGVPEIQLTANASGKYVDGSNNTYHLGLVTARKSTRLTLAGGFEEMIPTAANIYLYDGRRSGTASASDLRLDIISVSGSEYFDESGNQIAGDVYALIVEDKDNDITDVIFFIVP